MIYENYSSTHAELLTNSELIGFLKDFLRSYDYKESDIDIVLANMNKDSEGSIDRYNLAVFFLNLAAYEYLVKQKWIEQDMDFHPQYQT